MSSSDIAIVAKTSNFKNTPAGYRQRILGPVLAFLATCTPCLANPVWFDETNRSTGYASFTDLAAGYAGFIGGSSALISFSDLAEGAALSDQYAVTFGVTFLNATSGQRDNSSGIHTEGGPVVKDLTGYDGSHRPDGDMVFRKIDNDLSATPFTILFDEPVATVGALVGMGTQGGDHSLSLSVYDDNGRLIGTRVVESQLWETDSGRQNYESFFAFRTDAPVVSRIEILNNSDRNSANALVIDDLTFSAPIIPEPVTGMLLLAGVCVFFVRRQGIRRRAHALMRCPTS